jgi:hypothetical protein
MRDLNKTPGIERIDHPIIKATDHSGAFKVMVSQRSWFVIATVDPMGDGKTAEHISVSHRNPKKMPDWDTLTKIKDLFFYPEEECVQFFPKHSQYVNMVENCLHIWRPVGLDWEAMAFDVAALREEVARGKDGRGGSG